MSAKENNIRFANDDTIAAIITPPGEGGIGAVRIAGPRAGEIIAKRFRPADETARLHLPFHMYYGYIVDRNGDIIDEVMMVQMPEGRSYTGQAQAEIFCHGGLYILKQILGVLIAAGARPAEPGEFTRRAFLAGRIDLARAEAVADLIASKTEFAYTAAKKNLLGLFSDGIDLIRGRILDILAEVEAGIDYPEEDIEYADKERLAGAIKNVAEEISKLGKSYKSGRIIREGYKIAIAGRPNAGKSSLFNLLLNQNRAIVAPVPGTTRDYLTEWIDLEGMAVSLTDTAGLRPARGVIETAGQKSAAEIIHSSDMILWIVDICRKEWQKELLSDMKMMSKQNILLIYNKIDKSKKSNLTGLKVLKKWKAVPISCKMGLGLDELRDQLVGNISSSIPDLTDHMMVTSERHKKKLDCSVRHFRKAIKGIRDEISPELISLELRSGINEIDEITGRIYNEEILDRVFERFCIGK